MSMSKYRLDLYVYWGPAPGVISMFRCISAVDYHRTSLNYAIL